MMLIILFLFLFIISFLTNITIIKVSNKCGFCIDHTNNEKTHRIHEEPVPRTGGIGIFIAFLISQLLVVISQLDKQFSIKSTFQYSWILSSSPVFLIGFFEDLRADIEPKIRLLIISIATILAIALMNAIVYDIGLIRFPLWLAIPFTIFSVVGVTNSFNIIDGCNGLASGTALIALISFSFTSYIHEDTAMFSIILSLFANIMGFFILNFPKAKTFLGDSGAYVIGFMLALISVLIVNRNPEISPWYPVVALSYPIFETLFSIYRRIKKKRSFIKSDRLHFHTLIFKRITKNNPKTSIYLLLIISAFNIIAFPFRSYTSFLICIFVIFSLTYIYIYRRMVRFKTPFYARIPKF